jgi:predicted XRE-type DNA-binding protein
LPENPTELEQAKYKIAKNLLAYQQRNKLAYEEIAKRIGIELKQTMEVLRGNIASFSLDELVIYSERLAVPLKMKITVSTDYGKKRIESFA